ncbi:MAG: ribonuclease HII [Bacillota bacterium]|nr:MAG: ribonuclease HII [Bacillota bacterium]
MATLRMERLLWSRGYRLVAGVDEVGRGPLAGPVVAAAVILPVGAELPGVTDSKRMTEAQREEAYERICATALAWGIGVVGPERIDQINIRNAAFEAMAQALRQALDRLPGRPDTADFLLVDGNAPLPGYPGPQRPVVGGDRKVLSIAAASVLAKVTRDRMALEWEAAYPGYGFARHKGYGTREHREALLRLGPCPLHRRSFLSPVQTRLF